MRVRIFHVADDGALTFSADDRLSVVMPERNDDYNEALDALLNGGSATIGGGAAPQFLLIRADDDVADDRESRILRRAIARRVASQPGAATKPHDDLLLCLDLGAVHEGDCPLRLRDMAAADISDVVHDVMGISRHLVRRHGAVQLDTAAFMPRFAAV